MFDTLGVIGEAHRKPHAQDLADRVSTSLASFARTGDPGNRTIPAWPAYTADKRATMVFKRRMPGRRRPRWRGAAAVDQDRDRMTIQAGFVPA